MHTLAGLVVAGFGLFLIGLAAVIAARPRAAEGFFHLFASTPRAHFTEQALRLAAGGAMAYFAPSMRDPGVFALFGWLTCGTSIALMLLPWRWHRMFAGMVIPHVIRHMKLFAFASFSLGAFVLYGVSGATG